MFRKYTEACQYLQIQHGVLYSQERSETQLHTVRGSQKPLRRWVSLGFLFHVRSIEEVCACVTFQSFEGIRSTQPTRRYVFFLYRTYAAPLQAGFKTPPAVRWMSVIMKKMRKSSIIETHQIEAIPILSPPDKGVRGVIFVKVFIYFPILL